VSPAKVAINSDRAIAKKLTAAWLPCPESSALQWPAPSNYRLNPEDIQNPDIQNHEVTRDATTAAGAGRSGHGRIV
jgi:hypothetical protein